MTKNRLAPILTLFLVSILVAREASAAGDGEGAWRMYSEELNGDVHFFDPSRMESVNKLHRVWNRVRYKTSVMGASSFQSLLEIDCSDKTEKVLQSTFYSDDVWKKPAMKTNKKAKPKRQIVKGSATGRLSEMLCDQ